MSDHWHRTENDSGRPYQFESAAKLLDDFRDEAERVLRERGVELAAISVEETRRTK